MLRQNPHNVHEWHKRVKLFNGQPHKQILTYTEAVTTVDVEKVSISTSSSPALLQWAYRAILGAWGYFEDLNGYYAGVSHSYSCWQVEHQVLTPALLLAGCWQAAHALDRFRKVL
jgi:hypothetical protein